MWTRVSAEAGTTQTKVIIIIIGALPTIGEAKRSHAIMTIDPKTFGIGRIDRTTIEGANLTTTVVTTAAEAETSVKPSYGHRMKMNNS